MLREHGARGIRGPGVGVRDSTFAYKFRRPHSLMVRIQDFQSCGVGFDSHWGYQIKRMVCETEGKV